MPVKLHSLAYSGKAHPPVIVVPDDNGTLLNVSDLPALARDAAESMAEWRFKDVAFKQQLIELLTLLVLEKWGLKP